MKRLVRTPLQAVLILVALLLALHLLLPYLLRDYLNDKLADMGDYRGQISDVDLAWWRGAYRLDELLIVRKDQEMPVPFVQIASIDIAVSWRSLWNDRAIVAEVIFERPVLNFVDGGENGDDSQSGEGTDWREELEELLPITLNELRLVDGQVSFRNYQSDPQVDVRISEIQATFHNLTNVEGDDGTRVARFGGDGLLLGHAPVEAQASFDPFKDFYDFEMRLRARDIDLTELNDLSGAYGKFDFKAGNGDLVIEASAEQGQLDGYIKPLLHDVEIFDWQQDVSDSDKGFFRSTWEALVGISENVLKNQSEDQFATRVPLSGSLQDAETSPLQAFIAILRNGFVEAFDPRFEGSSDLQD